MREEKENGANVWKSFMTPFECPNPVLKLVK